MPSSTRPRQSRPGGRRKGRGRLWEQRASLSERALDFYEGALPEGASMTGYLGLLLEGLSVALAKLPRAGRARLEALLLQAATMQQLDAARVMGLLSKGLGEPMVQLSQIRSRHPPRR